MYKLGIAFATLPGILLNIPDSENVVSVIAVGYRGQEPPERPKRKELEVVAKFI